MPTFSRASHPVSWLSSGASGACGEWDLDDKKKLGAVRLVSWLIPENSGACGEWISHAKIFVSIPSCQPVGFRVSKSLWKMDFGCQNFRKHSVLTVG